MRALIYLCSVHYTDRGYDMQEDSEHVESTPETNTAIGFGAETCSSTHHTVPLKIGAGLCPSLLLIVR